MDASSDNKRIAKNTIFLYIRTLVVLIISLYTSRIVLKVLGVEDLGIYNVVGGIVALMSFFQSAQAAATSRFITFELGVGCQHSQLRKVFSVSLSIHILISVLILLLGETLGLIVLKYWTNIPHERQVAAFWVYQLSLITFIMNMIRVPFHAVIIAQENMSLYAYLSIFETILKLVLVLILQYWVCDHLIWYGVLLAGVALITFLFYLMSVYYKYPIYKGRLIWDKIIANKIIKFSGWTLLGSSANVATQQGVGLLFNNFVGLVANAAMGFTNQVNAGVSQFVSSFTTAFKPQIIKLYAQQDYSRLHLLINRASKFSFVLAYIMVLPLICNMDYILHLWLNEVPQYTTEFCQIILICTTIDATTGVYNTAITATGEIRIYQILISLSFILDLILSYILLTFHFPPYIVFASRILTRGIINMCIGLCGIRKLIDFRIKNYVSQVLVPIFFTVVISLVPLHYICPLLSGWSRLLLTTATSMLIIGTCAWLLIFNSHEREVLLDKFKCFYAK